MEWAIASEITTYIKNFRKKVEDIIVVNWEKESKALENFQKLLE